MKKTIIFLLAVLTAFSGAFSLGAAAYYNNDVTVLNDKKEKVPYTIETPRYYVESLDTGVPLFAQNETEHCAPASLTKIVTAIVALENCPDLTTVVEVPERCITMLAGTGSSLGGLKAGEQLTMKDLLACLLIASANEAATTVADFIGGGSIDAFVDLMNQTAARLGCKDSHFVNVHGLDEDGHYSCPKDMAAFAKHALTFPAFKELTALTEYKLPQTNIQKPRTIRTTNFMMLRGYKDYYLEQAKGIKTGSTTNAGKCLVTTATKDGYSYICCMMGAPYYDYDEDGYDENFAFMDAKAMLTWTFNNIRLKTVASASQIVTVADVKYASGVDHVRLVPKTDYLALVPDSVTAQSVLIEPVKETLPQKLEAPLKKGDEVCDAVVMQGGQVIARIRLVVAEDVKRNVVLFALGKLGDFTHTPLFRVLAVFIVLVAVAVFALRVYVSSHKRRRKIKTVNYRDVRKK